MKDISNGTPMFFVHPNLGSVRTVLINQDPWFVGRDAANVLGYSNPWDALSKHVDDEDKNTIAIRDGIRGNRWYIASAHRDKGWIGYKTLFVDGSEEPRVTMSWTQKGRMAIHAMLDAAGFRMTGTE